MPQFILCFILSASSLSMAQTSSTATTTTATQAKDECVMNFAGFKSPLDSSSKNFKTISEVQIDSKKKLLKQSAELQSGEKIEFSGGGCAHIAYTFTFSHVKPTGTNIIAQAGKALLLLESTPVTKTDSYKRTLVESLREFLKTLPKKNAEQIYPMSCGSAHCQLDLHETDKINISYDFAL